MAVTAALVKELREKSGAGMMDCKKALTETNGDIEASMKLLREKGLATAAKRSGKVAAEGLALVYICDCGAAGIAEINSETDFVAKNEEFKAFAEDVAKAASKTDASNIEEFLDEKLETGTTIKDTLTEKIGKIGENLQVRRFQKIVKDQKGSLVSYIHGGGKIATVVYLACENEGEKLDEACKNVAMQVAAMNPTFVSQDDMDQAYIDSEKEILINNAKQDPKNANKPDNIIEKIIGGRLQKQFKEVCLTEQAYIKGDGESVREYLAAVSKEVGAEIKIISYVRYEVGEGIEKQEENFADEVAKVVGGDN